MKKEQTMLSRNEIANTVAVVSDEIVLLSCVFAADGKGTRYTYKALKSLADTLYRGDAVIVSKSGGVGFNVCRVCDIDIDVDLETSIEYHWAFAKVDEEAYAQIIDKEQTLIDDLQRVQRRKMKVDMLNALGENADDCLSLIDGTSFKVIENTNENEEKGTE